MSPTFLQNMDYSSPCLISFWNASPENLSSFYFWESRGKGNKSLERDLRGWDRHCAGPGKDLGGRSGHCDGLRSVRLGLVALRIFLCAHVFFSVLYLTWKTWDKCSDGKQHQRQASRQTRQRLFFLSWALIPCGRFITVDSRGAGHAER